MSGATGLALITGASSGIGAAYADRLARRGHDLILVARRRDRLDALGERLRRDHGGNVEIVVADLASEAGVTRVAAIVRDRPTLAMLVNCAGLGALGPAATVDAPAVDRMVSVNVGALTHLSLVAAHRFAAAGGGTIVNIASILAVMTPPSAAAYAASKAYVLTFSRSLKAELASRGVTIQVVLPGPVRSEFFGDAPIPFPETLIMSPEALVDTALAALDQDEDVTFPNLDDLSAWRQLEAARAALVSNLTRTGAAAHRYAAPSAPSFQHA